MATLVLTAVGSAIGGPIGGAIGSIIGQQVDAAIFAPKPREGPRLKELEVQTSSYGSQSPAIFGAMRMAGTVIWATDLIERRAKSGGGKGRPSTVNYSYSVSMAVALSSRPISHVGRIWADGNLIRGGAGDLKVDTQLRIATGHDDQPLDPLMASAEVAGQCPAYRGVACAVFEDLQLADFGNRIPSLTFEIFEREGTVPVLAIVSAATDGAISGQISRNIGGYALAGASAADAIKPLFDALSVDLHVSNGELTISDRSNPSEVALSIIPIISEDRAHYELPHRILDSAGKFPYALALRYYDRARDYLTSVQRSERGPFSRNQLQIDLPAVLDAQTAGQIAETRLCEMQSARAKWRGDISVTSQKLSPGAVFYDDAGKKWKIDQLEHRFGSTGVIARAAPGQCAHSGQSAAPGRNTSSPDLMIGETRIAVVELPVFGVDDPGKPLAAIFASGTESGWRRAALSLRVGESLVDIGGTAAPAIMGISLDPLLTHSLNLLDEASSLRVQMLNEAMDIAERDGSPLDADAPYFWLSGEFVRFGKCEALGNKTFLFSRFRRGCFQSNPLVPMHSSGEQFVLIEPRTARIIDDRVLMNNEIVVAEALGLGDSIPQTASGHIRALAIIPMSPVHGEMTRLPDGGVELTWVRRSRIDGGWVDGTDQLMVEGQEQYLVTLIADGDVAAEWTTFAPKLSVEAMIFSPLADNASTITAMICQIGRYAKSAALRVDLL